MIQTRVEYQAKASTDTLELVETFEVITGALFQQSFNRVKPDLERALRTEPPRRPWGRNDFVSDASRRAFFAKTGGRPYQRTGRYRFSWMVSLRQTEGGAGMVVSNNTPWAKWVGGTFDRSRDFQQRGHKRTGWPNAQKTTDFYKGAMLDDFGGRLNRFLDERLGTVTTSSRNR